MMRPHSPWSAQTLKRTAYMPTLACGPLPVNYRQTRTLCPDSKVACCSAVKVNSLHTHFGLQPLAHKLVKTSGIKHKRHGRYSLKSGLHTRLRPAPSQYWNSASEAWAHNSD